MSKPNSLAVALSAQRMAHKSKKGYGPVAPQVPDEEPKSIAEAIMRKRKAAAAAPVEETDQDLELSSDLEADETLGAEEAIEADEPQPEEDMISAIRERIRAKRGL